MARRPSNRRPLSLETCEERIALSASGFPTIATPSTENVYGQFARRNVTASDNSTATARDLGAVDGSLTVRNQYVGPFDTRDVFRFELERNGQARINLHGMRSDADVYLLNSRRETVASSRNSGWQADVIQQDLSAGEYFIVVQNYSAWRGTGYSLGVSATLEPAPDPIGNTFDTAKDLGQLQGRLEISDSVGRHDGLDVFRFEVDQVSRLNVALNGLQQDVDLYLYSQSGTRLIASDRSGTSSEQISGWLATGSYYLVVDAYDSASSQYTLVVNSSVPTTPSQPTPPSPSPSPTPAPTTPPATETPSPSQSTPPASEPSQTTPTPTGPLSNVPFFGSSSRDWGLNSVNAPEAWAAGYTGEGITVAIIDSGVQTNHADLTHSIWINDGEIAGDGIDNDRNGFVDDVRGWDFIDRDNSPTDVNGHGTHVAGIVAGANNQVGGTGVAYASNIMPIRVLDENGSGSTHGVAQGIRYAVDNGAQIINLSLGGGNSQSVYSALRYAEQNNVLVVAASGNESAGIPGYPAAHSASLSNVLSVGAYTSNTSRASFSNRVGNSDATQIDAPGQTIYSTYVGGSYRSLSGTSMATPFVSGVAALAWAANPALSAGALRNVLTQSVGAAIGGSDSIGRVDAATAIPLALSGNVAATAPSTNARSSTSQSFSNSQRVYALVAAMSPRHENPHLDSDSTADANPDEIVYQIANPSGVSVSLAESEPLPAESVSVQELELTISDNSPDNVDEVFADNDWSSLDA